MSSSVWYERLRGGGYRGRWRKPDGKSKGSTRKGVEFPGHPYARQSDALAAAQEAWVRDRRQAVAQAGTLPADMPWGEWWDTIKDRRVTTDTSSDRNELNTAERYLRTRWGSVPLNVIARRGVQHWVDELAAGRAPEWTRQFKPQPATVYRIYALFRWSMNLAFAEGVLDATPCFKIKVPKVLKKRKAYLSVSARDAMAPHMRQDYRDLMEFEHETGLRPSEGCGVHECSIDRERRTMHVEYVYVARKRVMRPCPKDKDARVVPLTDRALEIVGRNLQGRDLNEGCGVPHSDGTPCDSPLVFITAVLGRPIHPEIYREEMKKAADAAGLRPLTPMAVRRGTATRLADGGASAWALAQFFGHATLEQSEEYVQQSLQSHDQLRAALGDHPPLQAVDTGGSGGKRGAAAEKQPTRDYAIDSREDTG